MKLLLAIPTAGSPAEPFLASLAALQLPESCTAIERYVVTGNYVPAARELIVRQALERSVDLLAMIDDDMVLPPDALVALLAALDDDPALALVGGLYYSRDGLRPMAADPWRSSDTREGAIPAFADRPVRVDAVGFGCVLMRASALRQLEPPFIGAHIYVEESRARVRICNEDYLLCERLRAAGYGIALHGGVRCGHYDRATRTVLPQSWEPPEATAEPRMMVVEPGPRYRLVPYDPHVPLASERQEAARLTYLFVD